MHTASSSTSQWRFPSALALALVGGAFCGPMVQASGYGGIVTWLLCVVALALITSLVTDRFHYAVSGLVALTVLTSTEVVGLISNSQHGGDASVELRRNLDVLGIMLAVGLVAATITTLLVRKWRRR